MDAIWYNPLMKFAVRSLKRGIPVFYLSIVFTFAMVFSSKIFAGEKEMSPLLNLGSSEGSWVLEIFTSGGFAGHGRGDDFAISSDGNIFIKSAGTTYYQAMIYDSLISSYFPMVFKVETPGRRSSRCDDCFNVLLVLWQRGPANRVHKVIHSWVDFKEEEESLPEPILKVYREAMKLKSLPAQADVIEISFPDSQPKFKKTYEKMLSSAKFIK